MIEAIAAIAGIAGSAFVTQPRWRMAGFGIWIVGNILWVSTGIHNLDFWFTLQFGVYEITAIVGFVTEWRGLQSGVTGHTQDL